MPENTYVISAERHVYSDRHVSIIAVAPVFWNALPVSLTVSSSAASVKKKALEKFLFHQ